MNNNIEKTSGIYAFKNLITNEYYIGKATNMRGRTFKHLGSLNKGEHYNKHLQSSWNKYGKENFELFIVEKCNTSLLDEKEKHFINFYDSFNNGFNQTLGGDGLKNYRHTEDAKCKISKASKERKHTPESIEKIRKSKLGKKRPKDVIEKIAAKKRGQKISEDHIQAMRKSTVGKKLSNERREKLSIAAQNRKKPVKISPPNLLNENQKEEIKEILLSGQYRSISSIANQYKVSRSQIYTIIKHDNIEIK